MINNGCSTINNSNKQQALITRTKSFLDGRISLGIDPTRVKCILLPEMVFSVSIDTKRITIEGIETPMEYIDIEENRLIKRDRGRRQESGAGLGGG